MPCRPLGPCPCSGLSPGPGMHKWPKLLTSSPSTSFRRNAAAFTVGWEEGLASEQPVADVDGGPPAPSPAMLLAADSLQQLLRTLAQHLDAVVFRWAPHTRAGGRRAGLRRHPHPSAVPGCRRPWGGAFRTADVGSTLCLSALQRRVEERGPGGQLLALQRGGHRSALLAAGTPAKAGAERLGAAQTGACSALGGCFAAFPAPRGTAELQQDPRAMPRPGSSIPAPFPCLLGKCCPSPVAPASCAGRCPAGRRPVGRVGRFRRVHLPPRRPLQGEPGGMSPAKPALPRGVGPAG